MSFKFENLEVWKLARKFILEIYKLSANFPKEEMFGLSSQIRRASVSIATNIAEGSNRKSDPDFSRFLRYSLTSLEEVVTALYIALDLKYINDSNFNILYDKANEIAAKLQAFLNSISNSSKQ